MAGLVALIFIKNVAVNDQLQRLSGIYEGRRGVYNMGNDVVPLRSDKRAGT
jgi:hypothetical protein